MTPVLITGVYGAGKTEFCVRYALALRKELGGIIKLADMDILNPYFRSREKAGFLAENGVKVIGNLTGNTGNQDLPAISGEVMRAVIAWEPLVVDLAGSVQGFNAIVSFKAHLREYELWVTVNAFREESSNTGKILRFIEGAQSASGLKVTGIVNNSHMVRETTADHVLRGQDLALEASVKTGLPVKYTFLREDIYKKIKDRVASPVLTFDKLIMREDWQ